MVGDTVEDVDRTLFPASEKQMYVSDLDVNLVLIRLNQPPRR